MFFNMEVTPYQSPQTTILAHSTPSLPPTVTAMATEPSKTTMELASSQRTLATLKSLASYRQTLQQLEAENS